jgi:hypothetical protein
MRLIIRFFQKIFALGYKVTAETLVLCAPSHLKIQNNLSLRSWQNCRANPKLSTLLAKTRIEDARKNVCIIIFAEHWQSLQKLSRSADGSDKLSNFLRYSFPLLSSSILEWFKLNRALQSAFPMARLPNLVVPI